MFFFLNSTTHLTEGTAHVTFLSPLKVFPPKKIHTGTSKILQHLAIVQVQGSPNTNVNKGAAHPKKISKPSAEGFVWNRISIYRCWFEPTKWVESEYFALLDFGFSDVPPSQVFGLWTQNPTAHKKRILLFFFFFFPPKVTVNRVCIYIYSGKI